MRRIIPALLALMLVFVFAGCELNKTGEGGSRPASSIDEGGSSISNTATPSVTKESAKAIALAAAGVTEGEIREYEIELDRDNGVLHYDVEFKVGNVEYEYEIDAQTGDIRERDREIDK